MALPRKASGDSKHMLFTSNAIIWVLFTVIYWAMDRANPGKHFGPQFNPVYYGVVVHTTIGFGDIVPQTPEARWVTSAHAVLTLVATLYYL